MRKHASKKSVKQQPPIVVPLDHLRVLSAWHQKWWNRLALLQRQLFFGSLLGIVFFLSLGVGVLGYETYQLWQQRAYRIHEKEVLVMQQEKWWQVTRSYPDYRDGYYHLAVIEYRLGNIPAARENVLKALAIDPNFKAARTLEGVLGGK